MKRSDLFREYARVIDMCEGTSVAVEDGIKYRGKLMSEIVDEELSLFVHHPEQYEFALAILEGKPVFKGDEVYFDNNRGAFKWDFGDMVTDYIEVLTWAKPRTFTLNGEVLPCPREKQDINWSFNLESRLFYFDSAAERDKVRDAILRMLIDAKNS